MSNPFPVPWHAVGVYKIYGAHGGYVATAGSPSEQANIIETVNALHAENARLRENVVEFEREAAANRMQAEIENRSPSNIYRPRLSIDGDQWCALLGENLQDGVAGFGKSPHAAYRDFDRAWYADLAAAKEKGDG